jgi:hypothetical protein
MIAWTLAATGTLFLSLGLLSSPSLAQNPRTRGILDRSFITIPYA